jgi:quinol---cytochrome-c reductase cytochrome c subunit
VQRARILLVAVPLLLGVAAWFAAPGGSAGAAIDVRRIYLGDCATCHAANGRGTEFGPSLATTGRAGTDFYLTTGRMPLQTSRQAVERHSPKYGPRTIRALVDYVAAITGNANPEIPNLSLAHANIADGGVAYRLNCAACHAWSGRGGALLHRDAPSLRESTPTQVAEATRVGPGNMPRFGTSAISNRDLNGLVEYTVRVSRHPNDRGGQPLWHIGPLAEGAVAVAVGFLLLLLLARAIGTRA